MNILYLADPGSIHDEKWISFFAEDKSNGIFVIPRKSHAKHVSNRLKTLGVTWLKPIDDVSVLRWPLTLVMAKGIKRVIKLYNIQIIHLLYAEPNSLWCLFRRYFGTPMIISTRGTDVLKTIPKAFEKKTVLNVLVSKAYRRAFKNADVITCTSYKQAKSVTSFSLRSQQIHLIRTGVDLDAVEKNSEKSDPLMWGTKFILFPRYIWPVYNHEFCLRAITLLSEKIKRDFTMVFVGKDAGDLNYQNYLISEMDEIKDVRFVFLGKQDQPCLIDLYKRASVVIMTPFSDGSPVSAMEAILCGSKVILGPLDYDKELFDENSIILKEWREEELAQEIENACRSEEKIKNVSPGVKKIMSREYNMRKLEKIYQKLLIQ